jgi:hypothetical protein
MRRYRPDRPNARMTRHEEELEKSVRTIQTTLKKKRETRNLYETCLQDDLRNNILAELEAIKD